MSVAASVLLTVLGIAARVLLCVLAVVLLLLLLILLAPVYYQGEGGIRDPEPHEEPEFDRLLAGAHVSFSFRWLLGAVRGRLEWPGEEFFGLRILWFTVGGKEKGEKSDLRDTKEQGGASHRPRRECEQSANSGSREMKKQSGASHRPRRECEQSANSGPREMKEQSGASHRPQKGEKAGKPDPREKEQKTGRKAARAGRRTQAAQYAEMVRSDAFRESFRPALRKSGRRIRKLLVRLLPSRWKMEGTAGLGDPERTGRMLSCMAALWPFLHDHVELRPEFMEYQADIKIQMQGKIRLIRAVACALALWLDPDVRQLAGLVRKERAGSNGGE